MCACWAEGQISTKKAAKTRYRAASQRHAPLRMASASQPRQSRGGAPEQRRRRRRPCARRCGRQQARCAQQPWSGAAVSKARQSAPEKTQQACKAPAKETGARAKRTGGSCCGCGESAASPSLQAMASSSSDAAAARRSASESEGGASRKASMKSNGGATSPLAPPPARRAAAAPRACAGGAAAAATARAGKRKGESALIDI